MRVETIPILSDNYAYLVICEKTAAVALIDPAEADPVLEAIKAHGVTLEAIWCTHHHWDHVGGVEQIRKKYPVPVFAHASDRSRVPGLTDTLEDGDRVRIGQLEGTVVHTPGHTRGGIVYLVGDAAFTGDALFSCGCGRLFEGDPQTMYTSLNQRLAAKLTPNSQIYCGHEYTEKNVAFARSVDPNNPALSQRATQVDDLRSQGKPTIPVSFAIEQQTNPFLRCDEQSLRESLRRRFPRETLETPVQVFAKLRQLRDGF